MKTAISGQDKELISLVAGYFGRCCFFHIYDDETDEIEIFENCDKGKKECTGEAVLQCLIEKNVKHIVSANFGEKVQQEMENHDIKMTVLTDYRKTVGEIIRIVKRKHIISMF